MQNLSHSALPAAAAPGKFRPISYDPSFGDFVEPDPCLGEAKSISPGPANSIEELYAHALMAGAQAIAACDEIAEFLETRGSHDTAALFQRLAFAEAECAVKRARQTDSLALPKLRRWRYNWLYGAPPDQAMREIVAHLMTPHSAIRIALDAEYRSLDLYERLSFTAVSYKVRALARELAAEKMQHVQWLSEALASVPAALDWKEEVDDLRPAR